MRVGANLNAKGWTMISEGLEMLEVATAGADVPTLWELFETFFGKVEDDTQSNISAPSTSGHAATFRVTKRKTDTDGQGFTKFALLLEMMSQVTLSITINFINGLTA